MSVMWRATGGRWRIWLNAILATSCGLGTLGCRGILGHEAMPADPMFAKRKPAESKATTAAPLVIAFAEPPMPTDPYTALATAPRTGPAAGNVRGILTSQPAAPKAEEKQRRQDEKQSRDADGPVLPPSNPR